MTATPSLTRLTPLIAEASAVAGADDLGRLLQTLVAEAKSATGAPYVALGVLGEHGVMSEFIYDGISAKEAEAIGHPPMGRGVLGTVIRENSTIVLDSISGHPDSVGFPRHHPEMNTFLGVPVAVANETFGNLYLANKETPFTDTDVIVVQALSRIAGTAVHTARLQGRLRRLAVVEDRQRIARDLHDSVIQDLFAVGLSLQSLQDSEPTQDLETNEMLSNAIDSLDASVTALRKYVFGLRESAVAVTTFDERVQMMVERMGSAYATKVELSIDSIDYSPWHDDLILLLTEALSNALRHSKADVVRIDVTQGPETLTLQVIDDGRGFDTTAISAGMGLANMSARAKGLAGRMDIESRPGVGTTIRATVPLSLQTG